MVPVGNTSSQTKYILSIQRFGTVYTICPTFPSNPVWSLCQYFSLKKEVVCVLRMENGRNRKAESIRKSVPLICPVIQHIGFPTVLIPLNPSLFFNHAGWAATFTRKKRSYKRKDPGTDRTFWPDARVEWGV